MQDNMAFMRRKQQKEQRSTMKIGGTAKAKVGIVTSEWRSSDLICCDMGISERTNKQKPWV